MDNKNPVFSRLDQQTSTSSAGFAYAEGMTAYNQAGQQPTASQGGLAPYPPAPAGPPTGSVYEPVTSRMTLDDVIAFMSTEVAKYKLPQRLELFESFPLGPTGKVLKRELAEEVELRRAGAVASSPAGD